MYSLPCHVAIETLFLSGADLAPGMDAGHPFFRITDEPPAVAKAFQGNTAVLTADAVIVADPFRVFTDVHSKKSPAGLLWH